MTGVRNRTPRWSEMQALACPDQAYDSVQQAEKLPSGSSANGAARRRLSRKGGVLRSWIFWLVVLLIFTALVIYLLLAYPHWRHLTPRDGLSPPWYPTPRGGTVAAWQSSYDRAAQMVAQMTLVEKVNLTTGTGWAMNLCVGNTGSANRLGFPMLCLQDGPLGIRFADNATYWPAGITTAATWNKTLIYARGRALGQEHRLKGVNVALGPCMGPLGRMPGGGRNWEGFGPDPVLAGVAAAQTIRGIQDAGVIATAKHFVANEQEHFRQPGAEWNIPNAISSNLGDRTLHELYAWPFQDSVRAGVGSVMCSYNMVNDSYACDNSKLLNGLLKDEYGFQGFVQSDWLAQRSGVASALAGLDMTMPGDGPLWSDGMSFWGPNLTLAALNGSVPMDRIDDMVTRIVATWYQLKQDEWPKPPAGQEARPNFSSFTQQRLGRLHSTDPQQTVVNQFKNVQGNHELLARQVAAEGTVLLKNDGILPLSVPTGPFRVGVFGEDADGVDNPNHCEDRACNQGTLATGWGSGAVVFPFLKSPIDALVRAFNSSQVTLVESLTNNVPENIDSLDLCLVFANADSGEGFHSWEGVTDRRDLFLQKGGDDLIRGVAEKCQNTVVVVHSVGPVIVDGWANLPNVRGIVFANLPGETSGDSLVEVLFGRVDATGRLPFTLGKRLEDYGPGGQIMWEANFPQAPQQIFAEGLYVDYRHFDHEGIEPSFPFGFGLSYTSWKLTNLRLDTVRPKTPLPAARPPGLSAPTYDSEAGEKPLFPSGFRRLSKYIYPYLEADTAITKGQYPYPKGYEEKQPQSAAGGGEGGNPSLWEVHVNATVEVSNTGGRKGQQVVQVYVSFPPDVQDGAKSVDFPVRVLRGFEKVELEAGKTTNVEVSLTRRDLSYWSTRQQNWVMPEGDFNISVGFHSRDQFVSSTW